MLCLLLSCSSDDNRASNPNLPTFDFAVEVNLNLPQFSDLKFDFNSETITNDGVGIKGVVIFNIGNEQYTAFELSDPNILPSDCSALRINGANAASNCGNDNEYSLITGQQLKGEGGFPLFAYRINRNGNTLFISN